MRRFKITLADELSLIAVLIFSFVCFLGKYFFELGNIYKSLLLTAIIALLLGVTAFGAKILKTTSHNRPHFVLEMISLVLFTCFMVYFSYSPFPHIFVVSGQQAAIKGKLTRSITQAEKIFEAYDEYANNRETLYNSRLRSVVVAKKTNPNEYAAFGFVSNIADSIQIEDKMFSVHADLFPSNYDAKKKNSAKWLANAKSAINNWWAWYFGIVGVVTNVESKSIDWQKTLVELSTHREKGEQAEDFTYDLSFDDVKIHFTTIGKPTKLSIGLCIGAYLIMLLTYFVSERHSKSPICKRRRTNRGREKQPGIDIEFS